MNPEEIISNYEQQLWEECQKSHDPQSAKALVELMSDISEKCMCAGWSTGTEITLWNIMHSLKTPKDRFWGIDEITLEEINQLQNLSLKCDGWWIWQEDKDCNQFLSLDETTQYMKMWEEWSKPRTI